MADEGTRRCLFVHAAVKCMLSSVESGLVDQRWMLPAGYWSWGWQGCNGRELCDGIVGSWCRCGQNRHSFAQDRVGASGFRAVLPHEGGVRESRRSCALVG